MKGEPKEDAVPPPPTVTSDPKPSSGRAFPTIDVIFGTIGTVLGLPTLLYPFGRDQGLYYYVAREWVTRGSIPYKDVLDHKTPGIYILHAISIVLFGQHQWSIRILELVGVLTFGLVLGSSLGRAEKAIRPGVRGAGMMLAALMYFGYFDFWNTAQSEIWYSGFGVCAVWAARRIKTPGRAALVTGIFAGLTALTKPPGASFVVVAVVLLALRLRRERFPFGRPTALFAAGAAAPILLVLGYFGVVGALPAMKDVVVGANAYYVSHEGGARGPFLGHLWWILKVFAPLSALFLTVAFVRLGRGIRKKNWEDVERDGTGIGLLVAAVFAVGIQGKFFLLHWGCVPLALVFLGLATFDGWSERVPRWARHVALIGTAGIGYACTAWIDHAATFQRDTLDIEIRYKRGIYDKRALYARFQVGVIGFYYGESYEVGKWLEEHTTPEDSVTVRGFQPEIYAVCNRRHRGRFFWTTFLTSPSRMYRRAEWLAEDARDLELHPPKYIVTLAEFHEGLDSAEYYEKRGYTRVVAFRAFIVLSPPAVAVAPPSGP